MKRVFVCALSLGVFACSGGSESSNSSGANGVGGDTGTPATAEGGGSPTATTANTAQGGALGTGGAANTGGTETTGGAQNTAVGGKATGGAQNTSVGGKGAGGAQNTGTGGKNVGGGNNNGSGGWSAGGGPLFIDDNPLGKDVDSAVTDLPKYYISNTGDDSKAGTSPDTAWKTVTNVPKDKAAAVYFERGGTFTAVGAQAMGRDGPAAFNIAKGSVWTSYGSGTKRPILSAVWKTDQKPTGAVLSPGGNTLISGLSFAGQANFGLLIQSDGNTIQDCEIDGNIEGNLIQLGFSVRGHHNLVTGNYIHSLHEVILDSGDVNTSGGAEAIVVNGTDHEIAYNTIVDCWTPNETLGGAEGGCLEVIARAPGEIVENLYFHHNYCERAVGLFEACSGNFAGTAEKVQENHAKLRNSVLAYNVVVDAMWLYLLQTANTDMEGLVFEHNTLIHGPANTDIPQKGAPGFGNFYDTDGFVPKKSCSVATDCSSSSYALCMNGSCYYQAKAQPGQITVRNNFFVVLEGATAATMKLPPGPDDVVNNIFSPKAPQGVTASTGKVTVVSDPGLTNSFRLTSSSPAVDKGATASAKPWPDFDGKTVPCGSAPDVGASEYCP
jgi:hypothetical protein